MEAIIKAIAETTIEAIIKVTIKATTEAAVGPISFLFIYTGSKYI